MIGGMITAPLLSLFVIPAIYLLWKRHGIDSGGAARDHSPEEGA
jgi:Cu(I)/Ag(I) efflux system membrane protein CusA/SilA